VVLRFSALFSSHENKLALLGEAAQRKLIIDKSRIKRRFMSQKEKMHKPGIKVRNAVRAVLEKSHDTP